MKPELMCRECCGGKFIAAESWAFRWDERCRGTSVPDSRALAQLGCHSPVSASRQRENGPVLGNLSFGFSAAVFVFRPFVFPVDIALQHSFFAGICGGDEKEQKQTVNDVFFYYWLLSFP